MKVSVPPNVSVVLCCGLFLAVSVCLCLHCDVDDWASTGHDSPEQQAITVECNRHDCEATYAAEHV